MRTWTRSSNRIANQGNHTRWQGLRTGVGDDTRNIEALLATIRALNAAKVKTKGDLVFVFTVQEETTMNGAKAYVKENKGKVDHYIALDGGYEGFTYAGIGTNWYRQHFIGPGGHTRSRTPPYSASLPLARAIDRIYQLKVPTSPSSNLNIGMLGGSEVVNAKASDAWFTVDLRSTSTEVIADLEKQIQNILNEEAARAGMKVKTEIISASPAAVIPATANRTSCACPKPCIACWVSIRRSRMPDRTTPARLCAKASLQYRRAPALRRRAQPGGEL